MGNVEAGADTDQQNLARLRLGQGRQAAAPRPARGGGEKRVVERRDQGIASTQDQCSTLGMERMNSLITASNWVPSSATIW
jgi:hypothetical protein